MRVLVDTCVVIDALQSRKPFRKDAEALFLHAANKRLDGFLTAKSVADIYYLTHRATHSDSESRRILSSLFKLFELLDTSGLDCRRALTSPLSNFEDAMMSESALRAGVDCIVTRNERDYRQSPVPVCSPRDLLEKLDAGEGAV